jgi:hypothetical protein
MSADDARAVFARQAYLAKADRNIRDREARRNRAAFAAPDPGLSLDELEALLTPDAIPAEAAGKLVNDDVAAMVGEDDDLLEELEDIGP